MGREKVKSKRNNKKMGTFKKGGGRVWSANLAFTKALIYLGRSLRSSELELQIEWHLLHYCPKKHHGYRKITIQYLSNAVKALLPYISSPEPMPCSQSTNTKHF